MARLEEWSSRRCCASGEGGQNSAYGSLRSFVYDEYFDYYRDYHAFWKLYGIGLPDQVWKLCYANGLRLAPGLSHSGFTS